MQKSKTESCSHSTLCTRRHNGVQTASAPEDDELTAGVRSRLLWRVQNRIGERQTSFIKQKARCRRQWSNDIQKLDDEYERRVAQLKKDRDQARAKLQNEHHTCDIRLLVVEKQLAEDSKLITSLSGQHHRQTLNLHEFQKQMKPLIQRHKTPISILVPSCVQHKPSSSLGVVIKLKEMRVCSVHEMLRDCFDDIHHAFSVDVASIMTSYIQFKVPFEGICVQSQQYPPDLYEMAGLSRGRIASANIASSSICIWDVENGRVLQELKGHTDSVEDVIDAGKERLLSCSDDNTLRLWDLGSGRCLHKFKGHTKWVGCVSMFPDMKRAASGSGDHTIRIWDLESGRCLKTLQGHVGVVNCVVVIDEQCLVSSSSSDRTIRVWDVESGRCVRQLTGHTGSVRSVVALGAFGDDKRVISCGADKTLRVWNIGTGECLQVLPCHTIAKSLAVFDDGRRVVSSCWDKMLRVWDTQTGECLKIKTNMEISRVCVLPGGRVLTNDEDATTYKSSSQESPTHFIMEKSMTASTTTSTQLVKMVEADGVDVDVDTSHSQPLDRMRVEDCTALTDIQHVLQRPDNEMGSVLPAYRTRWVISEDFTRSTLRRVFISSGLIHCVSELLVNVVDNASKNRGTTNLWVTVDDNSITVKNNGNTITVEKHKGSGKWAPELLTSQLRTSTEYSEERKECKTAGGRNGKGAKVANIMSLKYTVHIENQDDQDKKKKSGRTFHQVSRNNMRDVGKAVVCEKAVVGNFMSVTMVPDLERFGNTTGKFTQDTVDMLRTIVAQAAAIARLNATFNGVKIETNSFKSLVQTLCNIAPADNNKSSTKALGGGLDMPPLEDLGEEADVGTVSMKQEQQGDCQLDLGDKVEINSKPKVADTKLPMAFAQFGDMNTVFGGTHKRRNPYVWEVAIIPNVWVHGNVGGVACDSIMQNKSKPKSKAKTKSGDDGDDNDTLRVQGLWFVNGVRTWDGGSHVEGVSTALTKAFKQHMVTVVKSWVRAGLVDKECRIPSNQQLLLSYVLVCVNCRIASPEFGGQTKVKMIKSISKFRKQLTTTVFDKLAEKAANRIGWAQYVQSLVMRNTRAATKKLGATKARTVNVPKYEGANFAGKKGSQECTLMLVEGDSAKGFAVTGMSVVGRDRYGVFPLRGKVLNTLDYSFPKAMKNQELLYIVKILGLKPDVVYTKNNVSTLRYGSVMIMTDQDHDGSHIKSLVILFFWRFWPSLLEIGFLKEFNTPILKAIHRRNPKLTRSFFDQLKFDRWWKTLNVKERQRDWKTKYYKGLGTSTQKEIYGYFENLDDHVRPISFVEDRDTLFIAKAFDKKQSNKRKGWINRFVRMKHEANAKGEVMKSGHKESGAKRICDIVDYELVQYSWANCQRTLPSIIDGFKDGQRKAMSMPLAELGCLWTPDLLRRISANTLASSSSSSPPSLDLSKLLKVGIERKVLQHGSRTSEVRNYRYGDSALNDTIINMNQQFVGSNNISLLFPIGGFGNRHENGDNASSPRYIYTALNLVSAALFPPEDLPILHYAHMDDIGGGEGGDLDNLEAGGVVLSKKPWLTEEPTYFVPILPVVLMNQIGGIATGWSCNIPPHNPADLKAYTLRLISSLVTHTTPTHNTNVSADTLIKSALAWMDQNPCTIEPWFRGFTGTVHVMDDKKTKFQVRGTCRLISSSDVSKKKRARTSTTSTSTEPQVSKSTTATTDTTATTTTQRHVIEISEIPPGKKTRDIMDWLKSENAFVYNPALGLGGAKLKKPKGERGKKKSSSSSTTKIKVEKVAEKAKKRPKIGLNVDPRLIQLSDHKTDHEVRLTLTITLPNSEINAVVKAIQDRLVETIHYNNMNMFDANGTITRYKSVHHVFSHFVPQRLMAYERRKKWLIEQKEQSLVQMRATIAFIDLVFSNKIKLLNRPRREIQQSCRVHKLPEVNGNYQYLLRKSITTITLEESKRLRAQLVEQESLLAAIHSKSLLTMWRLDLERFQKCERLYRLYCEDMRSSAAKVRTRTKKRKAQGKQKTQRKRKFI